MFAAAHIVAGLLAQVCRGTMLAIIECTGQHDALAHSAATAVLGSSLRSSPWVTNLLATPDDRLGGLSVSSPNDVISLLRQLATAPNYMIS